jgi:hypothetical protein
MFFVVRFNPEFKKPGDSNMATCKENDRQQLNTHWQHKISGIEIELKEKQFMNDELEYYKEVKTKSKKNAHAESNKLRFLR